MGALSQTLGLHVSRIALAPWLIRQGKGVRNNTPKLPEPPGHRQGVLGDPKHPAWRLTIVGDSSAAGVGTHHQSVALAEPLAKALFQRTAMGLSWQLVAKTGWTMASAQRALQAEALKPSQASHAYHLAVLVLGVNDVTAQRSPAQYVQHAQHLIRTLASHGVDAVMVNGVPAMQAMTALPQPLRWYLGTCSRRLDMALRLACPRMPLPTRHFDAQWPPESLSLATDGFHPGPKLYPAWAEALADAIVANSLTPRRQQA